MHRLVFSGGAQHSSAVRGGGAELQPFCPNLVGGIGFEPITLATSMPRSSQMS